MPNHIILFRDEDFLGPHKHVFDLERNLNFIETDGEGQVIVRDDAFNEATSSMAILSGNWRFFKKPELQDGFDVVLGPGLYRAMGPFKLEDNRIVSLVSVDEPPTMPGAALEAHVVLFQHANFRGNHRHVFGRESDLSNNSFAELTSSVVVKLGNWSFFKDVQFVGHFDPVLGPGIYPWVEEVGIRTFVIVAAKVPRVRCGLVDVGLRRRHLAP